MKKRCITSQHDSTSGLKRRRENSFVADLSAYRQGDDFCILFPLVTKNMTKERDRETGMPAAPYETNRQSLFRKAELQTDRSESED
jgi:hypothetical protein